MRSRSGPAAELQSLAAGVRGRPEIAALAAERFHPWMTTLEASGLTRFSEGVPLNLKEYRESLAKTLGLKP